MGVSCSAPRDAGRAPDAGGGEGGESAAAASSALPATGFMQRLLDKVTGSSERAAPVMEAEPLSPKEAPAAAAVDPEDRMPLVGILVGRLSEEKLESMWRKYDPSDEGCLPKSKAAALLEDLIHYVPVYLRAVAQRSIAPIKKLAQEETDPLLRSGAVKLGAEFDNDVDKLLEGVEIRVRTMTGQRLATLIKNLVGHLDKDNDNILQKKDFMDAFLAPPQPPQQPQPPQPPQGAT